MDFAEVLAALFGWIGERVSVIASGADGEPALVLNAVGRLERGSELRGPSGAGGSYLFAIGPHASFVLDRAAFRGARWEDEVLRIEFGGLVIRVALEEPAVS